MEKSGVAPDKLSSFLSLLNACASLKSLDCGRIVHKCTVSARIGVDAVVEHALLNMYGKCGSLEEARSVFNRMRFQDTAALNAILVAYAQNGHHKEALELLQEKERSRIKPDKVTFLCLLNSCALMKSLHCGRLVHKCIVSSEIGFDLTTENALLDMYGRCGSLEEARSIFDQMRFRDTISWNAMLDAYAQNGHAKEALVLFHQMEKSEINPNKATFLCLLNACASLKSLDCGRIVHKCIISNRIGFDLTMENALLNMYGKCGSLDETCSIFNQMKFRDASSWNAMLGAYVRNGHGKEALILFQQMEKGQIKPNKVTFLCLLNACASMKSLDCGRVVHESIVASQIGLDIAMETALLNMYGKCGSIKEARSIFDQMRFRDAVSWNAMLGVYTRNGHGKEALQLFHQMERTRIKPDKVTFLCLLHACASTKSLDCGRVVHNYIVSSQVRVDIALETALLDMYGKCGSLEDARIVFDRMRERNVVSWNAMILSYARNGHSETALKLFSQMELEGITPNEVTLLCLLDTCSSLAYGRAIHEHIVAGRFDSNITVKNAIVNMYGKCGSLKDARSVFDSMNRRDTISWNSMLTSYVQNGHFMEAKDLLQQMDTEGIKPDKVTFLCLLRACANMHCVEIGKTFHEWIVWGGLESDVSVGTALLNMYSKCGRVKDARYIFDLMHRRDIILWNSMIAAYAQNGLHMEALEIFKQMDLDGVNPDQVTFLCLLNVCSGMASLEIGRRIHRCIIASGFESDVAVRNALLNMYGRCGSLKDANIIFNGIYERDAITWSAMVVAYASNGFAKEALELFQQMQLEGFKPDRISFLCLLNACSHAGLQDEAWHFFTSMGDGFEKLRLEEHYGCMIDLLGRAGSLTEAEALVKNMPMQIDTAGWITLLGACRNHNCA